MIIEKENLHTLWYENEDGIKYVPRDDGFFDPPDGYRYQHTRFPNSTTHSIHCAVSRDEVDSCRHPMSKIQPTSGWVDGVEGRECSKCRGTQVKNATEPWPVKWEAEGSRETLRESTVWNEDIVLAIWNFSDFNLYQSILIATISCERCMNSIAHEYGLEWGYPEYSEEWQKAGTVCEFCEKDGPEHELPKKNTLSKSKSTLAKS